MRCNATRAFLLHSATGQAEAFGYVPRVPVRDGHRRTERGGVRRREAGAGAAETLGFPLPWTNFDLVLLRAGELLAGFL